MTSALTQSVPDDQAIERDIDDLLGRMTLEEKLGQMNQLNGDHIWLRDAIRAGRVGSVLNEVHRDTVNELQRIAVEESRLGIPLLIGRDVIHGFETVMPIPLGQAATWNPDIVREAARAAALEASSAGINWTFAPMIDVTRDPRWGRIAESPGEDPYLASAMAVAMVEGFQGDDLAGAGAIAACAKHFAGYGAVESGRDYATANIPEHELRNVHLYPFRAAVDAGVASLMTSFSDLNGVPASGNEFLLRQVLRDEWRFDGLVVSDWDSIRQLAIHGLTEDDRGSALAAATAGVDVEMVGESYIHHLPGLIEDGRIDMATIDATVANVLRIKFRLGLFASPDTSSARPQQVAAPDALATARQAALQSAVLLKNTDNALPLRVGQLASLAVIGPLADAPREQMGTWAFDGNADLSVTPLHAIRELAGSGIGIRYVPAMANSRSHDFDLDEALDAARRSDATVLFLGEEAILSGEAHCRADIGLPGAQAELVRQVSEVGKPLIAVIQAGRPLTLSDVVDRLDAILYAWHPGSMGGPAIADLLFGVAAPSGKLPVTFPRMVGQVPIYYSQKNTGKPPSPERIVHIDEIDAHAPQTSLGMTSFHLDAGFTPLFPFGHGLSYTQFDYTEIETSAPAIRTGESLRIAAGLTNTGEVGGEEVVQLYVRDPVATVTRPVRELKGFQRVRLEPGESARVEFELHSDDLAFYGRDMQLVSEPGKFYVWIGGSSATKLRTEFRLLEHD